MFHVTREFAGSKFGFAENESAKEGGGPRSRKDRPKRLLYGA